MSKQQSYGERAVWTHGHCTSPYHAIMDPDAGQGLVWGLILLPIPPF